MFPRWQELPDAVSSFLHGDSVVGTNPPHYEENPRSSVISKLSDYSGSLRPKASDQLHLHILFSETFHSKEAIRNNMNRYKTRCQWCLKLYTSPKAYSNHLAKAHQGYNLRSLEGPNSRKRRVSDLSDLATSEINMDVPADICLSDCDISHYETESGGSDKETRDFFSESESDDDSTQPDPSKLIIHSHAGISIREYAFPEQDQSFNLYAPFRHPVDYRLAWFFNSAKTSQGKIEQFFRDGILQGINLTHDVQFRSAYTMYKLVDTAANEPRWYSSTVDYPQLNGVQFHYRNIISAVKYLLPQKVYASDIVWRPQQELDKQTNRVYSEIITATWCEDQQVSTLDDPRRISD